MRIVKILGFCTLEVDPEKGDIWLNSPNCILRIQKLNFTSHREKFSMIDIVGSRAAMLEGDLISSDASYLYEKLGTNVAFALQNIKNEEAFLEGLNDQVKNYISCYMETQHDSPG